MPLKYIAIFNHTEHGIINYAAEIMRCIQIWNNEFAQRPG